MPMFMTGVITKCAFNVGINRWCKRCGSVVQRLGDASVGIALPI